MTQITLRPGDRVVYQRDNDYPYGNRLYNGETGTIVGMQYQPDRVTVGWDSPGMKGVYPYRANLRPLDPAADRLRAPLRAVPALTTEYEADSHHDDIAHPDHYTAGRKYEPKDVIRDWGLGFNLGAVVKYVSRAGRKADTPTLKDLRKARQFLDFEIEAQEAEAAK